MDQKWIHILVILMFCQKITIGACEDMTIKEGGRAEIKCTPTEDGTMVIWFRVLDATGMEFIGSYSNGIKKTPTSNPSSEFSDSKIRQNTLVLLSFTKAKDSGIYGCASLYRGNELKFGQVTRLVGEKAKEAPVRTTTAAKPSLCTTAAPCVCDGKGETSISMFCSPIILGPLAGGCGLLLLLLIVTALYCNKIRTRRCPHHYKRKPRPMPPGKQMMTNRHA